MAKHHAAWIQLPNGVKMTVADVARKYNLSDKTLYSRLRANWAPEDILLPPGARRSNMEGQGIVEGPGPTIWDS